MHGCKEAHNLWRPCYRLLQTVDIMLWKSTHSSRCIWPVWRKKISIKSAERERCTNVTAHTKVFQVIEGRNIPDLKKFLSVKENKQVLINFFGDFIVKFNQSNPLVPPGNLYYIAGSFGNCESCFRPGSLWLSWLVQHSRRGRHPYDLPGFTCWQKAQRIGKARQDHYQNLWYRCDCSLYLIW